MELVEGEGAVVESCRQTETVFNQVLLACPVAAIHGAYLWYAHMTFVHHQQKVLGEEVEQAIGTFARLPAVEIPRIVLYARAVAQFLNHFHVIFHPLLDALCPDGIAQVPEELFALHQVVLYHAYGMLGLLLRGDKKVGRIQFVFGE